MIGALHIRSLILRLIKATIAVLMVVLAISLDAPRNILPGMWKIITMQDLLITDYVYIAGVGATLVNAALVMVISRMRVSLGLLTVIISSSSR